MMMLSLIKSNLIGVTHDRAACLSGKENGFVKLLTNEIQQKILGLPDPCHSMDLIIKQSLITLPESIKKFISDVHNYFISPQRKKNKGLYKKKIITLL